VKTQLLGLELFTRIAKELSLSHPRPINQQQWADELGITQPNMGKLLDAMVAEGWYVEHPKQGVARMFTVNPTKTGVQDHYNRQIAA